MKNLLLIIGILLMVIGCVDEPKTYRVKMAIFYPTKIDTVTVENKVHWYPNLTSYKGTNSVGGFYQTTAPIKIISITEVKDSTQIK